MNDGSPVKSDPLVPPNYSGSNVLLVDDNHANLVALTATLEPLGARLVEATSGDEALRCLLQQDFACVLLDVQMPGLDGFETARLIKQRERTRHVPILFITAVNREEAHIVRGYAAGAVDYILKPFAPETLRAKVAAFLALDAAAHAARAAAQAAHRDLHLLDEVVGAAPVGIVLFDRDCRLLRLNPFLADVYGTHVVGALGKTVQEVAPGMASDVCATVEKVLGSGQPQLEHRTVLPGARGEPRYFLTNYYPVVADGALVGVGAIVMDVTERTRAENEQRRQGAELRLALQQRDTFLSVASHELKTPLTSLSLKLQGLTRFVEQQAGSDFALRHGKDVDVARRQVRRLSELVTDLLDVSRLGAGGLALELEEVDLGALLADLVTRFESDAARAGSSIRLAVPAAVVGRWDRSRLDQVFSNLLSNALKYGGGKPVFIDASSNGRQAIVAVRDEGIGIPAGSLERIFEKFERAVSERHYGGLGLGLFVTRQLVEAMGGTVRVQSEVGAGATFTVELPLSPPSKRQMSEKAT